VQAQPLLALAASVASEHSIRDVLNSMARGLADQPGVALARIWLLRPGDICKSCYQRAECADQTECLHLVASDGNPQNSPGEDWSELEGQYSRIPTANKMEGRIASIGNSFLISDHLAEGEGIVRLVLSTVGLL